jgi:dethiobiotin synthetase
MTSRPDRVVLVVGTGTGVGKTWVTGRLARALHARGLFVAARKPAQSYDPADDLGGTDAALLATATGDQPEMVCPEHRWYPVAMAPPMAAEVLGQPPYTIAEAVGEMRWPDGAEVGLVEAAGGVRSPIAADGDSVDLAEALRPDLVLLVAHAGLGTLNGVRLAAAPLVSWPVIVLLNRWDADDDLHRRNHEWLTVRDGVTVMTDVAAVAARICG